MNRTPRLSLRRDTLSELTRAELGAVGGGVPDSTVTFMCTALVNAVVQKAADALSLTVCNLCTER